MASIDINNNGNFIFEITTTKNSNPKSKRHSGIIEIPYTSNMEAFIDWYYYHSNMSENDIEKFLKEIQNVGREMWLKKNNKSSFNIKDSICKLEIICTDRKTERINGEVITIEATYNIIISDS